MNLSISLLIVLAVVVIILIANICFLIARMQRLEQLIINKPKTKEQPHEQKAPRDTAPTLLQNKPGAIPIYKNLTEDELPDNLQKVKVLGAEQVVDGTSIKINPQKVTVKGNGEKVQINISTDT